MSTFTLRRHRQSLGATTDSYVSSVELDTAIATNATPEQPVALDPTSAASVVDAVASVAEDDQLEVMADTVAIENASATRVETTNSRPPTPHNSRRRG